MFSGADPHKENFEPLFFREEGCCDEEDEDEGYLPGTTPLNMATSTQVHQLCSAPAEEHNTHTDPMYTSEDSRAAAGCDHQRAEMLIPAYLQSLCLRVCVCACV